LTSSSPFKWSGPVQGIAGLGLLRRLRRPQNISAPETTEVSVPVCVTAREVQEMVPSECLERDGDGRGAGAVIVCYAM
jgi:hypothetical protein